MSTGYDHTCGLASGVAYCWGNNALGQLGTGSLISAPTPAAVAGANTFSSISAGVAHSCGVTQQGPALCWGANDAGQLGTGTTGSATTPADYYVSNWPLLTLTAANFASGNTAKARNTFTLQLPVGDNPKRLRSEASFAASLSDATYSSVTMS